MVCVGIAVMARFRRFIISTPQQTQRNATLCGCLSMVYRSLFLSGDGEPEPRRSVDPARGLWCQQSLGVQWLAPATLPPPFLRRRFRTELTGDMPGRTPPVARSLTL